MTHGRLLGSRSAWAWLPWARAWASLTVAVWMQAAVIMTVSAGVIIVTVEQRRLQSAGGLSLSLSPEEGPFEIARLLGPPAQHPFGVAIPAMAHI
jgi:hypothetical protein